MVLGSISDMVRLYTLGIQMKQDQTDIHTLGDTHYLYHITDPLERRNYMPFNHPPNTQQSRHKFKINLN
jgi:hypothetical protein